MMTQEVLPAECEMPIQTAPLPLSHELLWGIEWIRLWASNVYRGVGVPRGNGEPVIVVPGFLGSYGGLYELRDWLARIGYGVFDPGFERNIDCPDTLLERLERRVAGVYADGGQPVRLIGHSLGGSLARAAASRMAPGMVEQVITLGSPLHHVRAHPLVAGLARLLEDTAPSRHGPHAGHDHGETCACDLADALALPFPADVRRTAVFTRQDGVVDWRTCIEGDAAVDVEVDGTHVGLVVNARAYEVIARALAA